MSTLRDRFAASRYDAIVVGAGPNGLAAAIVLARAGRRVALVEAGPDVGGACRTRELTLPGFRHDIGSSIHPLAVASPLFRLLPLEQFGLQWIHSPAPLAHPLDGGRFPVALTLERSVEATASQLDSRDAETYFRLMSPLFASADTGNSLAEALVRGALLDPTAVTARDFAALAKPQLAELAAWSVRSGRGAMNQLFVGSRARALLSGLLAHSTMRFEAPLGAAIGFALLAAGHAFGWPFPRGGAQSLSEALARYFRSLGGEIVLDAPVRSLDDLPAAKNLLLDVTPRQFLRIAADRLPVGAYRKALRAYRYGPSVFKLDWALDGPIPWADEIAEQCRRAATVHLGGAYSETADGERLTDAGGYPERPFVLLAQHTLFDPTRAPAGAHTAWGYCHVPFRSTVDRTAAIEAQVERFAPGFRKRIIGRSVHSPAGLAAFDPNLYGGDISGGSIDVRQLLLRPAAQLNPYRTPLPGVYLCSSSTPPGPGVHGMCGYYAARSALARE